MRALILTGLESCGQKAVSRALKNAFAARGDFCFLVGALEMLGPHPSLSQSRAMEQAMMSPRGFAFLSAGSAFVRTGKPKSPVYAVNALYADNLRMLLRDGEFDAVLCLNRYTAEAVSHVRKQLAFSARCCFVSCDYACVPFLEETRLEYYFTAHDSFTAGYVSRGIAQKKIVSIGIPLPADWFCAEERSDARALVNLPQSMPCFYLPNATDPAKAVDALLAQMRDENARVCVVSPEGTLPKAPLVSRYAGDVRVVIVDPEEPPARYFAACDAMLSAPCGALTAAAAVCRMPIVHLPAADPLEAQTALFFSDRGTSLAGHSEEASAALALALSADAAAKEALCRAQQGLANAGAAPRIVRFLHDGRL